MSPFVAGIAGGILGAVVGWFLGNGMGRNRRGEAPELVARQKALEDERRRLAEALSEAQRALEKERDTSQSDLQGAHQTAEAAAQENRRLIRRVRDLEQALAAAGGDDKPSAALEMQLVMAMRERDAAQKQLLDLEAKNAIERSLPPPGAPDPIGFDDLPELPDLETDDDPTDDRPAAPSTDTAASTAADDGEDEEDDADTDETLIESSPKAPDLEDYAETLQDAPGQDETADFTVIMGVGPATHTKLVGLGYTQLSELADLTEEALADLERALGSRRPSRDDWRGQARALVSSESGSSDR